MEPFLLKPTCKNSIWGGTKLKKCFHKEYPGDIISESWELSVHPAGRSLVASGPFRWRSSGQPGQKSRCHRQICFFLRSLSFDDQMDRFPAPAVHPGSSGQ